MSIFKRRYRRKRSWSERFDQFVDIICYAAAIIVVGVLGLTYALDRTLPNLFSMLFLPAAALAALLLKWGFRVWYKRKRVQSLDTVYKMYNEYIGKPTDFEEHVAGVFRRYDFDVETTPPARDGGVDLILKKKGQTIVGEVKLYAPGNKVGTEKIQKLHSAMVDRHADGAVFITTSDFTGPAFDYAVRNGVVLLNGLELQRLVKELEKRKDKRDWGKLRLLPGLRKKEVNN